MSEFRGRGRGRGGRGRGGPRGGGRGGYMSERDGGRGRGGFSRGRGDGFSRGRGGPPPRHMSRDDSPPPRKMPMMSRSYEGSDRGRGPPLSSRRMDRYDDSYDRGPLRSRDSYSPPPRDSSRLLDRLTPPRSSLRDRDYGMSSRGDYPSSRGDFLPQRHYSPPRDSGSYRDSYGGSHREDRRDSFTRPPREYRGTHDYPSERSRDFRDSGRDYRDSGRDYHPSSRDGGFRDGPSRREFRDPPMSDRTPPRSFSRGGRGPPPRGNFSDSRRSYSDDDERDFDTRGDSGRFSSRFDDSGPSRGPPHREYRGRGGMRGGMRGRDDRGGGRGFMNGSRGRGPPRGRGRPDFAGGRRSSPSSRDALLGKRPRMEGSDGYSSRR